MSSAILYVAIVVIWIGVLVPRWLRHDNTRDGHARLRRFSRHQDTGDLVDDAEPGMVPASSAAPGVPGHPGDPVPGEVVAEEADAGAYLSAPAAEAEAAPAYEPAAEAPPVGWSAYPRDGEDARSRDPRPGAGGAARPGSPRGPRGGERPGGPQGGGPPSPRAGARPGPQRSGHRARLMMARRRMLWILVVLTVFSLALAYLHLAAWWIVIPPTIMLLGYLMLLREAARADAEMRQRVASERAAARARHTAAAKRVADAGHPALAGSAGDGFAPVRPGHEPLPHAEVIDISARVGDQLYDQYADAKLRAVGD